MINILLTITVLICGIGIFLNKLDDDRFVPLSYFFLGLFAHLLNVTSHAIYHTYYPNSYANALTIVANVIVIVMTGYLLILVIMDIWKWFKKNE